MMFQISPFRLKAVLIHLLVSAVIIAAACVIALVQWFPYPLFLLDGTWVALLTLAVVDLSLGPLLTLIISSNKKSPKELFFDFSVVICIQLAALSFGLLQIVDQRVVALVHLEGEFHIVAKAATPNQYEAENLPAFKNIRYGMLLHKDFAKMSVNEIETTLYNPATYRELDATVISKVLVPTKFVPEAALKIHGKTGIYKLVVGKKRYGVAVLNTDMKLVDIYLAKESLVQLSKK